MALVLISDNDTRLSAVDFLCYFGWILFWKAGVLVVEALVCFVFQRLGRGFLWLELWSAHLVIITHQLQLKILGLTHPCCQSFIRFSCTNVGWLIARVYLRISSECLVKTSPVCFALLIIFCVSSPVPPASSASHNAQLLSSHQSTSLSSPANSQSRKPWLPRSSTVATRPFLPVQLLKPRLSPTASPTP